MRVAGEGRTASQGGPHWGVHLDGVGVVGEEISTIITAATHPHAVSATHPMLCQQHTPCCVHVWADMLNHKPMEFYLYQ